MEEKPIMPKLIKHVEDGLGWRWVCGNCHKRIYKEDDCCKHCGKIIDKKHTDLEI